MDRQQRFLDADDLDDLFDALRDRGYSIVGPRVRDGAIVYGELSGPWELPRGVADEQDAGVYRLARANEDSRFGYGLGPDSWKRYLFPPRARIASAARGADGLRIHAEPEPSTRYALLGVRPCELRAVAVQDRALADGPFPDPYYRAVRRGLFVVVVNCGRAGGTCFCVSMGTGPRASEGFDLALTELVDADRHGFVVESGSDCGDAVLADLPVRPAREEEQLAARRVVAAATEQMGRELDTSGIRDLLEASLEHPRWDDVARRCLSCASCTLVCPTCFCSTFEDVTDLAGEHAERVRRWDSCFTMDFSYLHGGSVRHSPRARYRQWLTHKLGTWIDQFGTSGCVGCGRCITWCPAGIDITEEVRAIRARGGAS